MKVSPIKALSDNYIWVIEIDKQAIVVDPGEARGVLAYLEENKLNLQAILLTHKHEDHVDGVEEINTKYPEASVFGPVETRTIVKHAVGEGDYFTLLGQEFRVFKTAGHSEEHISYLTKDALFSGDALFSAGCGRVFTGDYQAQYDALQKFKQLADDVKVYCGHEYTQTNLRFAHSIRPDNQVIADALVEANEKREKNAPTLPSTIGKEKEINLFLQVDSVEDFIKLRTARDDF